MTTWPPKPISHHVWLHTMTPEGLGANSVAAQLGVEPRFFVTWPQGPTTDSDDEQLQAAVDELVERIISLAPKLKLVIDAGRLSATLSVAAWLDRKALLAWDAHGEELITDPGFDELVHRHHLGPAETGSWKLSKAQLAALTDVGVGISSFIDWCPYD